MKRPGLLDQLLNVAITVAVLVLVVLIVRREFSSSSTAGRGKEFDSAPFIVSEWEEVLAAGLMLGLPTAPIRLVVFEDLECPYCRQFHDEVLAPVLERFRPAVNHVFVHYPLPIHRFARQAAQAVECAHADGKASEFIDTAYTKQDSLGLIGWGALGGLSGIRDTTRFGACSRAAQLHPRIQKGLKLGERLAIIATPTVMINGLRFSVPPSRNRLVVVIDSLLGLSSERSTERSQ